jgi:EmrB/QacA subfamily drug resistance transporter
MILDRKGSIHMSTAAQSWLASSAPATQQRKWWTLAATCFGLFMVLLDVTIVNVALPTIGSDLHTGLADLQWVVNAYVLTLAVFLVTAGRLGDIFGRKRLFCLGLGIFTLGSLLCGLAGHISIGSLSPAQVLYLARGFQGLGGAFLFPLSLAIISVAFDGKERGAAIGIWSGVGGLATAIGPLVGGLLVEHAGWQWIFFINVPIGVIGIGVTLSAVRESRDERAPRSIDVFGLVTITVSAFCLLLALIQGNDPDKGWTSGYILILFAISAVCLVAFVIGELRLKNPMVDPRLFKNPSFTGAGIVGFTLSAGMLSQFFFLALYLQNSLGLSPVETGLRFLPLSVCMFLTSPVSGRLTDRIGSRPLMAGGMALVTIAVLLLSRITPSDTANDWTVLLPGFIVGGLGMGLCLPPIATVAVGTVGRARAGMASGTNSMLRNIGNAFGIAFLGAILTSRYNSYLHDGVMAIKDPSYPAAVRSAAINEIEKGAGTIGGSTGLRGPQAAPYMHQPHFADLQQVAHTAFVQGEVDILRVAAVILAIGTLAGFFLIRPQDMYQEEAETWQGAAPAARQPSLVS